MAERRAIEAALKSLCSEDDASQDDPPPKSNKRVRRDSSSPAERGTGAPDGPDVARWGRRHDRKCCVCRHRQRAEIEGEFLHWRSAESIAKEYGIAHHSSIYRHAHAAGLFAQRATHLRLALAPIIEQAMVVPVTADSVVRAVALCARLTDDGQWIEPPRHVIHHSSKPDSSRPFPKAHRPKDLNVAPGSLARQPFHACPSTESAPIATTERNPKSENAASTT